jgi:hypothetical protein
MVRCSQSMGVHPRLGRGDAASGLLYSEGPLQARREMTRLRFGELPLASRGHFLRKFRTWNLELGTWNLELLRCLDRFNKFTVQLAGNRGVQLDGAICGNFGGGGTKYSL